jgi:site-specific recombinase XerC
MTTKALTTTKKQTPTAQDNVRPIVNLVLDSLISDHSRRAYEKALLDLVDLHAEQGCPPLSKALVQAYKTKLQGNGLAPSTINQRLSAIRKLAREAVDNGLVDHTLATGIKTVKGVKSVGRGRPASPRSASSCVSTRADTSTATG